MKKMLVLLFFSIALATTTEAQTALPGPCPVPATEPAAPDTVTGIALEVHYNMLGEIWSVTVTCESQPDVETPDGVIAYQSIHYVVNIDEMNAMRLIHNPGVTKMTVIHGNGKHPIVIFMDEK